MLNLTVKVKVVSPEYCYGWLQVDGNDVKGIVADGKNREEVERILLKLFTGKIAIDYGMKYLAARPAELEHQHMASGDDQTDIISTDRKADLAYA